MQPPHRPGFPPYMPPPSYGAPPPYAQGPPAYPQYPGQYPYQQTRPPIRHDNRGYARPAPRQPFSTQGGTPAKSTTLWVGKIAATVEPHLIRALLEACGPLKEWKPASDPATGTTKGFGFCTYMEPEGVLVALGVLDGQMLDGQALSLKCNSATDAHVHWYKTIKEKERAAAAQKSEAPTEAGEFLAEDKAAAREKVLALAAGRDAPLEKPADATTAATEFLTNLGAGMEQPDEQHRKRRDREDSHHGRKRRRESEREPERALPASKIEVVLAPTRAPAEAAQRKRPVTVAAFHDEENEEQEDAQARRLIPIKYSDEELKAAHDESGTAAGTAGPAAEMAGPAAEMAGPVPKQTLGEPDRKKQLMALVPKERDAIFAYAVKWEMLDSAPQDVKKRLAGWVGKKVKALVGDDADATGFAEFIVEEVHAHRPADQLLSSLQDVLDEDAPTFVMQLFKLLIFQTEELATTRMGCRKG